MSILQIRKSTLREICLQGRRPGSDTEMQGSVSGLPQPLGEEDDLGSHVKQKCGLLAGTGDEDSSEAAYLPWEWDGEIPGTKRSLAVKGEVSKQFSRVKPFISAPFWPFFRTVRSVLLLLYAVPRTMPQNRCSIHFVE